MSDLKHLTYEQLCELEAHYKQQLGMLEGKLNNKKTQLEWAVKYKEEKKPKTIDFAQLPVDTLVKYNGDTYYIVEKGIVSVLLSFCPYKTYKNLNLDQSTVNVSDKSINLELCEGHKVVWEGSDCTLPDGVEVNLGYSYFDDETQAWLPYSRETEYMTEGEAVDALKYWEEGC